MSRKLPPVMRTIAATASASVKSSCAKVSPSCVHLCQVQRYHALKLQDYVAPRLDSVAPMAPTHADGAREEINGCSRRMMMHRYT